MNIYEVSLTETDGDPGNVWVTAIGLATSAMAAGDAAIRAELDPLGESELLQLEVLSISLIGVVEFQEIKTPKVGGGGL